MLSESRSQKGRGEEQELGTEDLNGGPFKKQTINTKKTSRSPEEGASRTEDEKNRN